MRGFEDHEIKNDLDQSRSRIHPNDLIACSRVSMPIWPNSSRVVQNLGSGGKMSPICGYWIGGWPLGRGWHAHPYSSRSEANMTERKQQKRGLRQGEERYRSLVDNAPDAAYSSIEENATASLDRGNTRGFLNATGPRTGSSARGVQPDYYGIPQCREETASAH